jgi:hypothetical protein
MTIYISCYYYYALIHMRSEDVILICFPRTFLSSGQALITVYSTLVGFEKRDLELFKTKFLPNTIKSFNLLRACGFFIALPPLRVIAFAPPITLITPFCFSYCGVRY